MHQHHWHDLHLSLHFFLIFPDFLSIFTLITILGNVHRPCTLYLNIINKYTSCLPSFSWLFAEFFIIFAFITILGSAHRPCKQYTNIVGNGLHHILYFFLILDQIYSFFFCPFIDFSAIFVLIPIFGNGHRPHQQYSNILNDSIMSIMFAHFFLIFRLYLHWLSYLEICTDHINSTLTPSITV